MTSTAPPPSLAAGAVLGAFRVERFIARGGMGEVYEGVNTITGVRRALKVVRPDLLGDADMRARFVRETTLAARIKHPNVVEAWDPLVEAGWVVLPMELLEGETLAERLEHRGSLGEAEALDLAIAIGEAVAAFHAHGVIHRDLKPGNVFLARAPEGEVPKVLDFGAARQLGDERHTMTGHVVGSPAYMAPEQAMAVRDLDGRVDVYALGVVLYAMLTGRRPYESDEHGSAFAKLVQRRGFAPVGTLRSSLSSATGAAIARALAWERSERWGSMRELADALRAARVALGEGGGPRDSITARTPTETATTLPQTPTPSLPSPEAAAPEVTAPFGTAATSRADVPVAGPAVTGPAVTGPSVPAVTSVGSLPASAPIASAPIASAPIASAPIGSTPIASAPIASAPIASTPIASAPIASASIASAPIASAPRPVPLEESSVVRVPLRSSVPLWSALAVAVVLGVAAIVAVGSGVFSGAPEPLRPEISTAVIPVGPDAAPEVSLDGGVTAHDDDAPDAVAEPDGGRRRGSRGPGPTKGLWLEP